MNIHRGSDFNDFLIEEGIMTPTPTPRTDAIAHRGLGSVAYIAEMTEFARQLEREIADAREWSSKLADVADGLRADLATERALADRLAGELAGIAWLQAAIVPNSAELAVAAWKEARRGTP